MKELLAKGYRAKKRPSGHDISEKFAIDNGAAIPPNLIALPNTESNSFYLRYCQEKGLKQHPARYPADLPEYFVRMLTDEGDTVVDPFGGSCVTGEVAERLKRKWVCVDLVEEYLEGALGRFGRDPAGTAKRSIAAKVEDKGNYYRLARPGVLWNGEYGERLPEDGGRKRTIKRAGKADRPAGSAGGTVASHMPARIAAKSRGD
jgi:site-specific DNA-methyltransferase (cytosine-N4-specific)